MSNGVRIEYGAYAAGAKEAFVGEMNQKATVSNDETILNQDEVVFPAYVNPCELYSAALDGVGVAFSGSSSQNIGIWSAQVSGDDGLFEIPAELTLSATGLYSSPGISFVFDESNEIYASKVRVEWYRGDALLATGDFYPDAPTFFCEKRVDFYNKVAATFYGTNIPHNRLKLRSVEYGAKVSFRGDELRNVKIIQQVHPLSAEVYINTCDFELQTKSGKDYQFEQKQPLTVWFNDELIAQTFIYSTRRKSAKTWTVSAEDYLGFMANTPYVGGVYDEKNANALIEDIFATAKVPVSIDSALRNDTVTGHIPYTDCRSALQQVLMATGAIVDTSYSDTVVISKPTEEVSQTIPLTRIMQGQTISESARVTAVEVTSHGYLQGTETVDAYSAARDGEGDGILVIFTNPLHDLTITRGEILTSGSNFATINADEGCVLRGTKYIHTTTTRRRDNPLVLASDAENVISVPNATLVSKNNVDSVLERCYNYYVKTKIVNSKILERKTDVKAKAGDVVRVETGYEGTLEGRILKQTFSLIGGLIVKDTEVR